MQFIARCVMRASTGGRHDGAVGLGLRHRLVGTQQVEDEMTAVEHGERMRAQVIDRVLSGGYKALGSLEGRLDAINLHRAPTFTIWDRLSGAPVRVSFPSGQVWKDRVTALLGRRVRVSGMVRYTPSGVPRTISGVSGVEDTTYDPNQPVGDFGSVPELLDNGMTGTEYVKSRR